MTGKPTTLHPDSQDHGDVLTAVPDGLVALLKEFYGRGPIRAKSYYDDDLMVCVLRGGFSRVEQTLLDGGRGEAVINSAWSSRISRARGSPLIENATGKDPVGETSYPLPSADYGYRHRPSTARCDRRLRHA